MFGNGFFGGLFDFDGNGELDFLEKAADFGLLCELTEDDEDVFDDDLNDDLDDDLDDDFI